MKSKIKKISYVDYLEKRVEKLEKQQEWLKKEFISNVQEFNKFKYGISNNIISNRG